MTTFWRPFLGTASNPRVPLRRIMALFRPYRFSLLFVGMIVVAIANSSFSVSQTYVSTRVGQRVMHDLRTAVYSHLQRMSLAFFTRTRTGEVQSRIANDIGGMQATVTK